MKSFTQLYFDLDQTNRTSQKLGVLKRYFQTTPPADAAWALSFLSGERVKRLVPSKLVRDAVRNEAGLPDWLLAESYDAVGDFAEAVSLIIPEGQGMENTPLHRMVKDRLIPLSVLPDEARKRLLRETWRALSQKENLVWNKMITGEFRVGVSKTLVIRALAEVAGVSPGVMAHRLTGTWKPTPDDFQRLMSATTDEVDITQPYPFCLAYPLEKKLEELGDIAEWQAEWKWDGIRGQVIRRKGHIGLWSRGEELVTERFPEIQAAVQTLPQDCVLDGEILGWRDGRPLSFSYLQHRLGRKKVGALLQKDYPVVFMTYDLLEWDNKDLREAPLRERRAKLTEFLRHPTASDIFQLSSTVDEPDWDALRKQFETSRALGVEGLMLKRKDSPYHVGRQKGDWWKWKVDPYHVDAVLMYAQSGNGRRASLFTDYTFGVWEQGQLVPIAKAYSGLSDEEIREVDRFVRSHTVERFGPVRVVKPELVFELAFEAIQASKRHKAGVAVRFPRMSQWRKDKKAEEADTLETLKALIGDSPKAQP